MNNNQNQFNPFLAALIGGLAGAIVVYLSRETNRETIKDKLASIVHEGEEKRSDIIEKIDKNVKNGRKSLSRKLRQVKNQIMQA